MSVADLKFPDRIVAVPTERLTDHYLPYKDLPQPQRGKADPRTTDFQQTVKAPDGTFTMAFVTQDSDGIGGTVWIFPKLTRRQAAELLFYIQRPSPFSINGELPMHQPLPRITHD